MLRQLLRKVCSTRTAGIDHVFDRIKFSGPMTVAEYMKECLLHPSYGYYMQRDVFGQKGDFTTSPEVSQVFGELLAVWVLSDWMTRGQPSNCRLVELGPGRGTLLKDILRVFSNKNLSSILRGGLSLHLVEASPALSAIQEGTLQGVGANSPSTADTLNSAIPYKTCTLNSPHGIQASWYQRLQDVPRGHSYFIAHEFFDALPIIIHQFQRTAKGWREVLVDIDPKKAPEKALRFVLAPGQTPASAAYTSLLPQATTHDRGSEGEWCEVCPEGLVLAKELASRVMEDGGAALIADYGEETITKNTLRGLGGRDGWFELESMAPQIRPYVRSKYCSLDPYSPPLTLVVPEGLSPPWRDCFVEGQKDVLHRGALSKALVQNAKLKQCSRYRSWTLASEGLQSEQLSLSVGGGHPVQQWRTAWTNSCLCG